MRSRENPLKARLAKFLLHRVYSTNNVKGLWKSAAPISHSCHWAPKPKEDCQKSSSCFLADALITCGEVTRSRGHLDYLHLDMVIGEGSSVNFCEQRGSWPAKSFRGCKTLQALVIKAVELKYKATKALLNTKREGLQVNKWVIEVKRVSLLSPQVRRPLPSCLAISWSCPLMAIHANCLGRTRMGVPS